MLEVIYFVLFVYAIAGVIYNMFSRDLQWLFEPKGKKISNIKVILDTLAHMVVAIIFWPALARENYLDKKAKRVHG